MVVAQGVSMKIVVFSDIHGNQYAFTQFLQQIVTMNIDRCYFLGDVFGYYYGQNQCLAQLRIMKNLTCIWGKHDQLFWNVKMKKFNPYGLAIRYGSTYLRYWQITQANCAFMEKWHHGWQENVDGYRMGFFHGTVEKILDGRLYPDTRIVSPKLYGAYDFVFLGHTHHRMYRRINSTYVFNPGHLDSREMVAAVAIFYLIQFAGWLGGRLLNMIRLHSWKRFQCMMRINHF